MRTTVSFVLLLAMAAVRCGANDQLQTNSGSSSGSGSNPTVGGGAGTTGSGGSQMRGAGGGLLGGSSDSNGVAGAGRDHLGGSSNPGGVVAAGGNHVGGSSESGGPAGASDNLGGGRSSDSAAHLGGNLGGGRSGSGGAVAAGGNSVGGRSGSGGAVAAGGNSVGGRSGSGGSVAAGGSTDPGSSGSGGMQPAGGGTSSLPEGWLYTSGAKIYKSDGAGHGATWMARGVNIDDLYLCGGGAGGSGWVEAKVLTDLVDTAVKTWNVKFFRVSLSMNSGYTPTPPTWDQPSDYKTKMTAVIDHIGTFPGVYVLVTLRSDKTMTQSCSGNEATFVPTAATDTTYKALVNSFANAKHVLLAVSNEPAYGCGSGNATTLVQVMDRAVKTIRGEEDRIGAHHHIVAVQGNNWTANLTMYATSPLSSDNVVYEYHSYPPTATGTYGYTYANLPVIIGEYGLANNSTAAMAQSYFDDFEAKQLPNLAWDLAPYSNCTPDLVNVNRSSTNLVTNAWGDSVKKYLLAH